MARMPFLLGAAAFAVSTLIFTPTLQADETGFASMHAWSRVGSKTCFTDHTHYGSSSGHRSQRAAMRAAVDDWQTFTAGEYGLDWAYFHRANARMKSCGKDGSGWYCSIEGRPCKRGR